MNITPVVKQLLIINILFFIGSYFVPVAYDFFSLYYPENDSFMGWQFITHMFMHAPFPNIAHILFNMFALYSFGSALEHFWGGKKFLFFYISCGLGAALLHTGVNYLQIQNILDSTHGLGLSDNTLRQILNVNFSDGTSYQGSLFDASIINQTPVVGASGAIYGLLAAFAFMFPNAELALMFIPVPIKAKYFVPGILAIDLFLGFKGSSIFGAGSTGIAHFAHVGGALTGFLMMWFWKRNQFNRNRWN